MSKLGDERLLQLAAFLDKLPPERFNYESWVGEDWKGKTDLSCGTTACALGWACSMPEFQKLGLVMVPEQNAITGAWFPRMPSPLAREVFDLDMNEFDWLFTRPVEGGSEMRDASAEEVAEKIRVFVEDRRVPPEDDEYNEHEFDGEDTDE